MILLLAVTFMLFSAYRGHPRNKSHHRLLSIPFILSWLRQPLLSSSFPPHPRRDVSAVAWLTKELRERMQKVTMRVTAACVCWGAITGSARHKSRRLTHIGGNVGWVTHTPLATCLTTHAFSELLYHWTGFKWKWMPASRIDFNNVVKKREREREIGFSASAFSAWTILRSCVFDSNWNVAHDTWGRLKVLKSVAAAGEFLIIT